MRAEISVCGADGNLAGAIVLDADDYRVLGCRYGTNLARMVIRRGAIVRGS